MEITIDNVLYALDSTTISTSIVFAAWALGRYNKGTVKIYFIGLTRKYSCQLIYFTDGKWHDSNELDNIESEELAFYIKGKAYVDFFALYRFHTAGAIGLAS